MIHLQAMIEKETRRGYDAINAVAKVCQDIVLAALATGPLNRNVTIKGGVVMRSKTKNIRRATQDLDIDFIRYSLSDASIDAFISKLNCLEGIQITRVSNIEELKQQDYHGKRVHIIISDSVGNRIASKIDLGVHKRFEITQEEYCFDVALGDESASLLINSNEQMFAEKLRSLLKFGPLSTRFKDVFDLYYLSKEVDLEKLSICLETYIYGDPKMKENDISAIRMRVKMTFENPIYRKTLESSDKNWLGESLDTVLNGILEFLQTVSD